MLRVNEMLHDKTARKQCRANKAQSTKHKGQGTGTGQQQRDRERTREESSKVWRHLEQLLPLS